MGIKVGDKVWVEPYYSSNVNNGIGVVKRFVGAGGAVEVEFAGHGTVEVPKGYYKAVNSSVSANSVVRNALINAGKSVANDGYNLTGMDNLIRKYLTDASRAGKKGDGPKAAGFIIKARGILDGVKSDIKYAHQGQGNEGLIATATAFLKKWEPSFTGLPSSTKGWDGKITLPNSETDAAENCGTACNAKFFVGDRVEVIGKGTITGRVGRVVQVDASKKGWPYKVHFTDGLGDGEYAEHELALVNSVACNASVKPGDKVKVTDGPYAGEDGIVEKIDGGNVTVDFGGAKTKVAMGNVKALNAEEPVAENASALNGVATKLSLDWIAGAQRDIKTAMDTVRRAYAVYCHEIGSDQPNQNVKAGNSATFEALGKALAAAKTWYQALYGSQSAL